MRKSRWQGTGLRKVPDGTIVLDLSVAYHYINPVKPITYTRSAVRSLRRMPANTASKIVDKIEAYAADPAAQANSVKALKGRSGIRLRVGNWRVVMEDDVVLAVLKICPRGSIYE